ncbi:hypothetical protein GCM10020227_53720 [Streptomyces flavovirens]
MVGCGAAGDPYPSRTAADWKASASYDYDHHQMQRGLNLRMALLDPVALGVHAPVPLGTIDLRHLGIAEIARTWCAR